MQRLQGGRSGNRTFWDCAWSGYFGLTLLRIRMAAAGGAYDHVQFTCQQCNQPTAGPNYKCDRHATPVASNFYCVPSGRHGQWHYFVTRHIKECRHCTPALPQPRRDPAVVAAGLRRVELARTNKSRCADVTCCLLRVNGLIDPWVAVLGRPLLD